VSLGTTAASASATVPVAAGAGEHGTSQGGPDPGPRGHCSLTPTRSPTLVVGLPGPAAPMPSGNLPVTVCTGSPTPSHWPGTLTVTVAQAAVRAWRRSASGSPSALSAVLSGSVVVEHFAIERPMLSKTLGHSQRCNIRSGSGSTYKLNGNQNDCPFSLAATAARARLLSTGTTTSVVLRLCVPRPIRKHASTSESKAHPNLHHQEAARTVEKVLSRRVPEKSAYRK